MNYNINIPSKLTLYNAAALLLLRTLGGKLSAHTSRALL